MNYIFETLMTAALHQRSSRDRRALRWVRSGEGCPLLKSCLFLACALEAWRVLPRFFHTKTRTANDHHRIRSALTKEPPLPGLSVAQIATHVGWPAQSGKFPRPWRSCPLASAQQPSSRPREADLRVYHRSHRAWLGHSTCDHVTETTYRHTDMDSFNIKTTACHGRSNSVPPITFTTLFQGSPWTTRTARTMTSR